MFGVPLPEKIEGAAAVRRAIGVAHHHRGDGLERRVQFFGYNLPVRGERCALAEIAFARANQNGVVGMNLNPRLGSVGSSEFLVAGGLGGFFQRVGPTMPKPTNRAPPRLDETTARQGRAENIDRFFDPGSSSLTSLRHDRGRALHGFNDGGVASAAAQMRRRTRRRERVLDFRDASASRRAPAVRSP